MERILECTASMHPIDRFNTSQSDLTHLIDRFVKSLKRCVKSVLWDMLNLSMGCIEAVYSNIIMVWKENYKGTEYNNNSDFYK